DTSFLPFLLVASGFRAMLRLSISLVFLLSTVISVERQYPSQCETCTEILTYILMEFSSKPVLTSEVMKGLEAYCLNHIGGRESMCNDFMNVLGEGELLELLW
ncbi:hypothetical protein PFISCL1PPCAC_26209, partial [Pristionchus fissidentatus]